MSIAVILLQQLIIMVLLMAAGYLMFKGKKISLFFFRSLNDLFSVFRQILFIGPPGSR